MNNATQKLDDMIALAKKYHDRGDVAKRDQMIRNIADLPFSVAYLKAAVKNAGLKWA